MPKMKKIVPLPEFEPPPNKGGRPPFEATPKKREAVRAMTAYGIPQDRIASIVGCSENTLRAYFPDEIAHAAAQANAQVAQTLFGLATGGNVQACIFWMKARARWREVTTIEGGDPDRPIVFSVSTGVPRAEMDAEAEADAAD